MVGAHIAATDLQADPEGIATSVDNAIGDLKATTRSIVVRSLHRLGARG